VILAEAGTATQHQGSATERLPRFPKKFNLLLKPKFGALIIIQKLDAANNFIVVVFYIGFGPAIANFV
jgi:hypothetical protein